MDLKATRYGVEDAIVTITGPENAIDKTGPLKPLFHPFPWAWIYLGDSMDFYKNSYINHLVEI